MRGPSSWLFFDGRSLMKRSRRLRSFSLYQKVVAGILSGLLPLTTLPDLALALPHGGVVAKGQATLGYSTGRLLITQTTSSATFDWGSFTVKSGQSVVYKTPGSSSVSMNYIGGTTPSSIDGRVTSNGILYFMNPNGLIFGSGSVVSAAGVMAFGAATPWGKPTGAVSNAGVLTATDNGTVVLVGSSVTNTGTITAPGGEVLLAAGSTVTPISTTEGSSLSVATTGGGLVDDSGILSAETVGGKTGTVLLQSGMETGTTTLASTAVLDASAPNGGNGGAITVKGYQLYLDQFMPFDVSAPSGTPGTITIDTDVGTASVLEQIDQIQNDYLNDAKVCITLTNSIDLASGSTPYNWIPLGNSSNQFDGTFNGNDHVVSGYTIGTSSNPYSGNDAGFIGYLGSGGVVKNLRVSGTINASGNCIGGVVGNNDGVVEYSYNAGAVRGNNDVGGVVGENYKGTVKYSYNTGAISGAKDVGGVVGLNCVTVVYSYNTGSIGGTNFVGGVIGVNGGTIEDSYNTGSVSGSSYVGGVLGGNDQTLMYSYNTGKVSGSSDVGGVVGINCGTVLKHSYNTGAVSGSNDVGGIVGYNGLTADFKNYVTDNYYNTTTYSGNAFGGGYYACATNDNGITESAFGTASNLSNLGTFNAWNASGGSFSTSAPWFEGQVVSGSGTINAPMLVSDLPTATVAGSGSSVYSGSPVTNAYTTTYTMGGSTLPSKITVSNPIGPNVGSFTNTPSVSGTISAPTTQTSVYSVSAVSGTWTITPAPLTFSGGLSNPTKVYDGTTIALLTTSNSIATLSGFVDGQGATYTGTTGTYASPNTGTGIGVSATLNTKDFSTSGSGFSWSNYSLPSMTLSGTGTIIPATLTVTANSTSMIYGGAVPTTLSGTVSGFVDGQTLTGDGGSVGWSTSATSRRNVGRYSITGTVMLGPAYFGDYMIKQASSNVTAMTVNPAVLTMTANPLSIPYGDTVPTLSGTVTGFVNGQTLAGDGGVVTWTTPATSSSSPGVYAIKGTMMTAFGNVYGEDYTVVQASGNATALTITPAPSTSGSSGSLSTGSPSGGSGTPGGITSTHFAPVAQTAALTLSGPGTSISGNSSDSGGSSSSTSEDSITLSSGSGTSLSVVSTGGGDLTGDGILSSQEVKP